jgi:hypothetical protein
MNFSLKKNCSIFNNFPTIGQNIMKPTPCTSTHRGLSNGLKNSRVVWETRRQFKTQEKKNNNNNNNNNKLKN